MRLYRVLDFHSVFGCVERYKLFVIHIWNTRSCFQIELTLFTVFQLMFLREAKTCLPKTVPKGFCTWNFSISFILGEIKAFPQVWWYVSEKKQYWFVYATNFYHPSSIGKIKLVVEQKRLFLLMGTEWVIKKYMYISHSQVQQCERTIWTPKWQSRNPKLAGKNSTSRLCKWDSYVFAGRFSIYKSYFQCLFIQYHPTIVISHPNDLSIVFYPLSCTIT